MTRKGVMVAGDDIVMSYGGFENWNKLFVALQQEFVSFRDGLRIFEVLTVGKYRAFTFRRVELWEFTATIYWSKTKIPKDSLVKETTSPARSLSLRDFRTMEGGWKNSPELARAGNTGLPRIKLKRYHRALLAFYESKTRKESLQADPFGSFESNV